MLCRWCWLAPLCCRRAGPAATGGPHVAPLPETTVRPPPAPPRTPPASSAPLPLMFNRSSPQRHFAWSTQRRSGRAEAIPTLRRRTRTHTSSCTSTSSKGQVQVQAHLRRGKHGSRHRHKHNRRRHIDTLTRTAIRCAPLARLAEQVVGVPDDLHQLPKGLRGALEHRQQLGQPHRVLEGQCASRPCLPQ